MDESRSRGTIKTINQERGFAFIKDDGGSDFFLHISSVRGGPDSFVRLDVGDRVEFTPTLTARGTRAEDVVEIEG